MLHSYGLLQLAMVRILTQAASHSKNTNLEGTAANQTLNNIFLKSILTESSIYIELPTDSIFSGSAHQHLI